LNFQPLDPYRNPEFARDWSLSQTLERGKEHLPSMALELRKGKSMSLKYGYDGLFSSDIYNGNRHSGQLMIDTSGWKLDAILSVLDAKDRVNSSRFFRPTFNLERVIHKTGDWRLGMHYFQDQNEVHNELSGDLSPSSFEENEILFYFKKQC
jgi:hypothetical protein